MLEKEERTDVADEFAAIAAGCDAAAGAQLKQIRRSHGDPPRPPAISECLLPRLIP